MARSTDPKKTAAALKFATETQGDDAATVAALVRSYGLSEPDALSVAQRAKRARR